MDYGTKLIVNTVIKTAASAVFTDVIVFNGEFIVKPVNKIATKAKYKAKAKINTIKENHKIKNNKGVITD